MVTGQISRRRQDWLGKHKDSVKSRIAAAHGWGRWLTVSCISGFGSLALRERAGVRVRAGLRQPKGPSPYPSPRGRGNGAKPCCHKPFALNLALMLPEGEGKAA